MHNDRAPQGYTTTFEAAVLTQLGQIQTRQDAHKETLDDVKDDIKKMQAEFTVLNDRVTTMQIENASRTGFLRGGYKSAVLIGAAIFNLIALLYHALNIKKVLGS